MIEQARSFIAISKEEERYIFIYDNSAASVASLLEQAVTFAGNPDLSFEWDDAVKVCDAQRYGEVMNQTLRDLIEE